ncbi:MAG: MoaD/ThiS family protein [Caldilineales bacterium]
MIRVRLPTHLRTLAGLNSELQLQVDGPVTQRSVLDALEGRYPMLRGTIRDQVTQQRRPSCASSPARRTCPTSRPTLRSRTQ